VLVYCDYIAQVINKTLREDSYKEESLLHYVDGVAYDLHPEHGYMLSTQKTIGVQDKNGTRYRITIEEDKNVS
jgi:hypothetical protein